MTTQASGWEIVGMNGNSLVECGYVLPVIRRAEDDQFCVFNLSRCSTGLQWYGADAVAEFLKEGRWTPFPKPLPFPRHLLDGTGLVVMQPIVVFCGERFTSVARLPILPSVLGDEPVEWLKIDASTISATVASSDAVIEQLNEWGQQLLNLFDQQAESGGDTNALLDVSDIALQAAVDSNIRYRAYLRCCSVIEPERAKQTYDFFVGREFPSTTWDAFQVAFLNLRQRWLAMVKLNAQRAVSPILGRASAKLASISNSAPRNLIGAARVAS